MANRKLGSTVLLAIAAAAITACSADTSPEDAPLSVTTEALGASGIDACAASTSYLVVSLGENGLPPSCPPVQGRGGTWEYSGPPAIPSCTPTTAPPSSAPFMCSYDWTPAHASPNAAADVGALEAIPGVFVGAAGTGNGGDKACADTSYLPYVALMDQAGVKCPRNGSGDPNGPRECDVCGATVFPGVVASNLWLPSWSALHTIVVRLSNGSQHVLTVGPSAPRKGAARQTRGSLVKIALPRLPHGVSYVEGPALGYGYKSH